MKKYFSILFVSLMAGIYGCSQGESETVDPSIVTGTDDGTVYINDYFQLRVTKPSGWYAQDSEQTLKMSEAGGRMLSGDDKNSQAVYKEALKSTVPLFAFFEFEPGTPGKPNANVTSVAENISLVPGVKNGCDYLSHVRRLLVNSAMEVEVSQDCVNAKVGKANFGKIDVVMRVNGMEVLQVYNACVQNQHAIAVIQTYFDAESRRKVDNIVESLDLACM